MEAEQHTLSQALPLELLDVPATLLLFYMLTSRIAVVILFKHSSKCGPTIACGESHSVAFHIIVPCIYSLCHRHPYPPPGPSKISSSSSSSSPPRRRGCSAAGTPPLPVAHLVSSWLLLPSCFHAPLHRWSPCPWLPDAIATAPHVGRSRSRIRFDVSLSCLRFRRLLSFSFVVVVNVGFCAVSSCRLPSP